MCEFLAITVYADNVHAGLSRTVRTRGNVFRQTRNYFLTQVLNTKMCGRIDVRRDLGIFRLCNGYACIYLYTDVDVSLLSLRVVQLHRTHNKLAIICVAVSKNTLIQRICIVPLAAAISLSFHSSHVSF